MITVLRRRLKQYGFQAILWLTMIAMFITFLPSLLDRSARRGVMATVNGHEISFPEFAWRMQHEQERIAMFQQRFGAQANMYLSMFGLDNPQQNAVNSLVQEALVDQVAQDSRLAVDQSIVMRKLLDPQFIMSNLSAVVPGYVMDPRTGTINPQALQEHLERKGMPQEAFDQLVERALRSGTLMGLASSTVHIDPAQLKSLYERTALGRKYGIATFARGTYIQKAKATPVTDEQLEQFFTQENNTSKRYWVPEKRSGQVWQFTPESFGITVSGKQAQAFYDRQKHKQYVASPTQFQIRRILIAKDEADSITDALQERAQEIKSQLNADPTKFAELAKAHSDEKKTASKGGLSDWLTRDQLTTEVRRPLFRLQDGGISEVITTDEGLEIIQRVGRKSIEYKPFESVKEKIVTQLQRQKFKEVFEKEARHVIRQAAGNQEKIETFIKKKGGASQTYTDMPRSQDPTMQALFGTSKGKWQATLSGGNGVIVHVTEVTKKHAPALAAIKDKVTRDYYAHAATKLIEHDVQKAYEEAKNTPLEQVAKNLGAQYHQTPFITQESQEELQKLAKPGLPTEKLLELSRQGAREQFTTGTDGYLVQVIGVEPFDAEQFEAKREEIAQQLYREEIERKQRALVASLYRNATINLSDQLNLEQKA